MAVQTAGDILGTGAFGTVSDIEDVLFEYDNMFNNGSLVNIQCWDFETKTIHAVSFQYIHVQGIVVKKFKNSFEYRNERKIITKLVQLPDEKNQYIGCNFVQIGNYRLAYNDVWECIFFRKYAANAMTAFHESCKHIQHHQTKIDIVLTNLHNLEAFVRLYLKKLSDNNLCHLDIKPENILCSHVNLHDQVCTFTVSDFSFVRSSDDIEDKMGTPGYMSPYCSRSSQYQTFKDNLLRILQLDTSIIFNIHRNWNTWMNNYIAKVNSVEYIKQCRHLSDLYSLYVTMAEFYHQLLDCVVDANIRENIHIFRGKHIQNLLKVTYNPLLKGGGVNKSTITYTSTNRTYVVRLDKTTKKKYICMKLENSTKRTEKVYLSTIKGKYKYISK
jgi:serine/threonine protein kinase